MDEKQWSALDARAAILKALAHPARIFIVEKLKDGEQCVNALTGMIGLDTSTVSKHLSVLKNAGIVSDRKAGTSSYYFLRVPCILDFFGCVEQVIISRADQQNRIVLACKQR